MLFHKKKKAENTQSITHEVNEPVQDRRKESKKSIDNEVMINQVNELLQYVTAMDYVKQMVKEMNEEASLIDSVAASSQEISAAAEEISNFVQDSSKTAIESMKSSQSAILQMQDAFSQIEKIKTQTDQVNETMNYLNEETKKIQSMVGIIKSVADQTNLLALNASIEAARAGEQGRGFAVVADEIKKLADNTKSQVSFIQSSVSSLIEEVGQATLVLNDVTNNFRESKGVMEKAASSVGGISSALENINNCFQEITGNTEQQTAASEEMSSSLMVINDKTNKLQVEVVRTGKEFYAISNMIDKIRIYGLEHGDTLSYRSQIEICVSDHLIWRWRVYNMILGNVVLDEATVGTHKTCRLGKWIEAQHTKDRQIMSLFQELEKPHAALHELAKKAIREYKGGQLNEAERTLTMMDECSKSVIGILHRVKELY